MTVEEIAHKLNLEIVAKGRDQQVNTGYVSDLLSDVIANAPEGSLWITVQRHQNVIAVAQLKKIAGIILVRGVEAEKDIVPRAEQEGVYILRSPETAFVLAGKLYQIINK